MELPTCKRRGGRFGISAVETLSESFCPSTISNATALETWGCVLSLGFSSSEINNSRLLTLYEISLFFFFVLSQAWEKEKKILSPMKNRTSIFFLCPTLVTSQKTSFYNSLPSSKLTICLILYITMFFPRHRFQLLIFFN